MYIYMNPNYYKIMYEINFNKVIYEAKIVSISLHAGCIIIKTYFDW